MLAVMCVEFVDSCDVKFCAWFVLACECEINGLKWTLMGVASVVTWLWLPVGVCVVHASCNVCWICRGCDSVWWYGCMTLGWVLGSFLRVLRDINFVCESSL